MSEQKRRVVIYGGRGALGTCCVSHFKAQHWLVTSIDLQENEEADLNIVVTHAGTLHEQEENVLHALNSELRGTKVDAVLCVAGGWTAGNTKKDFAKQADLMWHENVWSSVISASIAAQFLKEGGLITLTGAHLALRETPGMIGYGMAKSAVHHLTKSLAGNNESIPEASSSGLPRSAICVAILPIILDTSTNRLQMPNADISGWTPLKFIVELLWKWSNGKDRPPNGSLVQVATKNFMTEAVFIDSLWTGNVIDENIR